MSYIINLFGGPGVGKSTIALGLVHYIKVNHKTNVDYRPEVAKRMIYENRNFNWATELDIILTHVREDITFLTSLDLLVTDGPVITNKVYALFYQSQSASFIIDVYDAYIKKLKQLGTTSVNILIERDKSLEYDNRGRNESLEAALQVDDLIKSEVGIFDLIIKQDTKPHELAEMLKRKGIL